MAEERLEGGTWSPGLIIAHNDATTHNAAWHQGTLTGFFDWDYAGPGTPAWDLALTGFTRVPLHVRYVAAAEGFTDQRAADVPVRRSWPGRATPASPPWP
jgi:aminoglycoside phosphotransferase (APT) family kinase protein